MLKEIVNVEHILDMFLDTDKTYTTYEEYRTFLNNIFLNDTEIKYFMNNLENYLKERIIQENGDDVEISQTLSQHIREIHITFGKYSKYINYNLYVTLSKILTDKINNANLTYNLFRQSNILPVACDIKTVRIDLSQLPSLENRYKGVEQSSMLYEYYVYQNNNFISEEDLDLLLNDNLILDIDFKTAFEVTSITDNLSTMFLIEYIVKKQHSSFLASKGIYDFNLTDYNILINTSYKDTMTALYAFIKGTHKVNQISTHNRNEQEDLFTAYTENITKHLDLDLNKTYATTLVTLNHLANKIVTQDETSVFKISHNLLNKMGNSYGIPTFIIDETCLLLSKLTNLDKDKISLRSYHTYSSGAYDSTQKLNLNYTSIYPFLHTGSSEDEKTLIYLNKFCDTGIINKDGSFEDVSGMFIFFLIPNNADDLTTYHPMLRMFYEDIFKRFLNSVLLINLDKILTTKYILATPYYNDYDNSYERYMHSTNIILIQDKKVD